MIVSLMSLHLMAAAAAAPAAQEPSPVPAPVVAPGTRVRVMAGQKRSGRIVEADGESLTLLPDRGGKPVKLRLLDVGSLEISQGRMKRSAAALRIGAHGFIAGGLLGALTGVLLTQGHPDCLFCNHAQNALIVGVFGATVGGVIGAVGGAAHPPERWKPVEGLRARVVLQPQRRGLGAALALSF